MPIFFYVGHSYSPSSCLSPFPNISSAEGERRDTLCQSVNFFCSTFKISGGVRATASHLLLLFLQKSLFGNKAVILQHSDPIILYSASQYTVQKTCNGHFFFIFYILKSFDAQWLLNGRSGLTLKHCSLCTQLVSPFHTNLR